MAERSKITENDFKEGDPVFVLGTYKGHPEYTDDVVIRFEAHECVTLPECYVSSSKVLNLTKSHIPTNKVVDIIRMIFSAKRSRKEDLAVTFIEEVNEAYFKLVNDFRSMQVTDGYVTMRLEETDKEAQGYAKSLFKAYLRNNKFSTFYMGGGGGQGSSFVLLKIYKVKD